MIDNSAMTDEDKYLFDVQGYLVIKNAIPAEWVAEMNHWIDAKQGEDIRYQGHEKTQNIGDPILWDPLFRKLLDNPVLMPYLFATMGDGVRLDHNYAIFLKPGGKGLRLHGGAIPYDPSQYYHTYQGNIYSGLTVVAYALGDVPEGMGGFGCVPGSHKSAFECPEDIRDFSKPCSAVQQVPVKAGDAILFTECLMHGTIPWRGEDVRRSIFFKFSPHHMSWSNRFYSPVNPESTGVLAQGDWTEMQRILLQPPGVYERVLPPGGKLRQA